MRFMVIVKANEDSEAGVMPTTEMLAEMGKYNEELVKAGVMLAGDGLTRARRARVSDSDGDKRTVTDGPFAETKELIAGFWIWQCDSMDDAIEWIKKAPFDGGTEHRNPPDLRRGRLRRGLHARAAGAGRAPPRPALLTAIGRCCGPGNEALRE